MTAALANFGYRLPKLADPTSIPTFVRRAATPYASEYALPQQVAQEAPELGQRLNEIARMTRWTNRTLAEIIGVTHPTIAKALRGDWGALSRSQDARQRLADAYMVVQRLHILAGRNEERLAVALDTPDTTDTTAIDYLIDRKIPQAYVAAARVLQPPRRDGLMQGRYPLDPRRAIVAIPDED